MVNKTSDAMHAVRLPLVERRFSLHPYGEVTASFSVPEAVSARLWRCSYSTAWPDREHTRHAYGEDGVQALLLAMEQVHRTLLAEAAYREDISPPENQANALAWMGQRDLGLPMPGAVNTKGLRSSLIEKAQEGEGDLDLVILHACTSTFLKVSRVAVEALTGIGVRCTSARLFGEMGTDEPDPALDAVLLRLEALAASGMLEVRGDLLEPRHSEVRRIAD